jgi:hypothetical protein
MVFYIAPFEQMEPRRVAVDGNSDQQGVISAADFAFRLRLFHQQFCLLEIAAA